MINTKNLAEDILDFWKFRARNVTGWSVTTKKTVLGIYVECIWIEFLIQRLQ